MVFLMIHHLLQSKLFLIISFFYLFRPNCFQIVVQHFSEEQYIFYFAGEATEQSLVIRGSTCSYQC